MSKTGSKRGPNRIFDAEAFGRPLESLLERSWRLLEQKKYMERPVDGQKKIQDRFQPRIKYRERPRSAQEQFQDRFQKKGGVTNRGGAVWLT